MILANAELDKCFFLCFGTIFSYIRASCFEKASRANICNDIRHCFQSARPFIRYTLNSPACTSMNSWLLIGYIFFCLVSAFAIASTQLVAFIFQMITLIFFTGMYHNGERTISWGGGGGGGGVWILPILIIFHFMLFFRQYTDGFAHWWSRHILVPERHLWWPSNWIG